MDNNIDKNYSKVDQSNAAMNNLENSRAGIKLLLSMKGENCENSSLENFKQLKDNFEIENKEEENLNYDDVEQDCSHDLIEEITEEEYSKTSKELDYLLLNIIKTKQKLRLRKLKEKIKTREDCLKYFGIKDNEDNNIPPEPPKIHNGYVNKFKINTNSKTNLDFHSIKEKLKNQKVMLSEKEKEIFGNSNDNLFITNNKYKNQILSTKKDEEDLFKEIKMIESKCDYLLDDIDEYIKLGEEFSK
jgi:hypothetical protein